MHPWFLGCRRTVRFTHELQELWITSLERRTWAEGFLPGCVPQVTVSFSRRHRAAPNDPPSSS